MDHHWRCCVRSCENEALHAPGSRPLPPTDSGWPSRSTKPEQRAMDATTAAPSTLECSSSRALGAEGARIHSWRVMHARSARRDAITTSSVVHMTSGWRRTTSAICVVEAQCVSRGEGRVARSTADGPHYAL